MRIIVLPHLLLLAVVNNYTSAFQLQTPHKQPAQQISTSQLYLRLPKFLRRNKQNNNNEETSFNSNNSDNKKKNVKKVDCLVVGGGVSGLTAAYTFKQESSNEHSCLVVEASPTFGGRVQSDVVDNYICDRGFAVLIESYPMAKQLLDLKALKVGKFEPGALVYNGKGVYKVADPIRRPLDLFTALTAPIGEFSDKVKVLPLLYHVFTSSVDELFAEDETDTLTCLKERWGFSDKFVAEFMRPFLEGIYLAKLNEQSSRMFHFVFKMFSEGAACLPAGGIGAVSEQLLQKCIDVNVELQAERAVVSLRVNTSNGQQAVIVKTLNGDTIEAKTVILATEGSMTQKLVSTLSGFETINRSEFDQTQRTVGCLYYACDEVPVESPILILNGSKDDDGPVNNICFPSVVSPTYASGAEGGGHIASVTILKDALDDAKYSDINALDIAARRQIAKWFPEMESQLKNNWKLLKFYKIEDAQPAQLSGPAPANVNGGRPCNVFREQKLPNGVFVSGDHVATATLNGALESGITAAKEAVACLN